MKYIVDKQVIESLRETARGAEDKHDEAVCLGILQAVSRIEKNSETVSAEEIEKHCRDECNPNESEEFIKFCQENCNIFKKLKGEENDA